MAMLNTLSDVTWPKKFLDLYLKTITFNHTNPIMISDLQVLLMMLVIIFLFPICDIIKYFTAAQPLKVEFDFLGANIDDLNGHGLVLSNMIMSLSSDGQFYFDLTEVLMFIFSITSLLSFFVNFVFFNKAPFCLSGKLSGFMTVSYAGSANAITRYCITDKYFGFYYSFLDQSVVYPLEKVLFKAAVSTRLPIL